MHTIILKNTVSVGMKTKILVMSRKTHDLREEV